MTYRPTRLRYNTRVLGLIVLGASALLCEASAQSAPTAQRTNRTQVTDSASFGGFYAQVGLGYQSFTPNYSDTRYTLGTTTYGASTSAATSQSVAGTVTLGYHYPVSSGFLLGIGAELSPIPGQSISVGGATIGNTSIPAATFQLNNSYNLFASLMFPVDKSAAFYGKVGYNKANASFGPNADSLGYAGYSFGLGYKSYVSGNVFAYIEANYVNYGNVSASGTAYIPGTSSAYSYSNNSSANAYNILYGIGVRF